ncbi:TniQ family protein [Pseudomonas putida]|uniref:TniQ family protein n=1 Tax=Pseudomonas putida TaxID=303 RepID=UPI002363A084|nr:TniQ family protein [Pseudomonas putida]MDD2018090.1 TniQ family protein [Pseudomonas putida]
MKSAPRWPLHPAPKEGEALSSWLNRVAACYQMDVHELLAHDLGHSQLDDLDTAPSLSLLTALCQRSGVELERLRSMSLAGWVPWLLDSLDDSVPGVVRRNPRNFRQPSSSPATSASRSMNLPSVWKV